VHAVDAILAASRRHAGELTLVCLGPLTNLAVALMIDPDLPARVPRLIVMGGAVDGRGNTERIKAEFNVGFDPEAADVVFRRWPSFELVDWEATMAHGIPFEWLEGWLALPTPAARLMRAIAEKRHAWVRAHRSATHSHLADALAMAVVLEPALVTESADRHLSVSLVGEHTRGMTVVDWTGRTGLAANARIARRIDQAGFERRVEAALRGR
jgi:purine nucleosidase